MNYYLRCLRRTSVGTYAIRDEQSGFIIGFESASLLEYVVAWTPIMTLLGLGFLGLVLITL